jgi:hypothetical protein
LFLTWYEAGLQVFNIVDPANPVHVGAFDTYVGTSNSYNGNWGVDLSLGLNTVLLSDRSRGLIVVDASGVLAPGDYNQDLVVDIDDYLDWRDAFGTVESGLHIGAFADGNGNRIVDAADYTVWRDNGWALEQYAEWKTLFGITQTVAAATDAPAVPEPCAALLIALATPAIWRRVRRRSSP